MRADLNERLEVFCEAIGQLEGWSVGNAGGYYAWVQHPFEHLSSAQVVKAMIEQCGVSALPGVCSTTFHMRQRLLIDNCHCSLSVLFRCRR